MAGWFPIFAAPSAPLGGTPNAPVLALTSVVSDGNPKFTFYGEWQAGDTLHFERQLRGGDWSSATTIDHTVTSGEIAGGAINLALPTLTAGNYQYRAKHKHAGGSYSGWSPYESGDINFNLNLSFLANVALSGSSGATQYTALGLNAGTIYPNRRIYIFGAYCDNGSGNTISSVKFNNSTTGVTLTQAGTGGSLRWCASKVVPSGATVDIEVNFVSGAFNTGHVTLYSCDDSLLISPTPTQVHSAPTSATTGSLSLTTSAGGATVFHGIALGISDNLTITSGTTDTYSLDINYGSGAAAYHVSGGTQARATTINVGWTSSSANAFLTAWSLR